MRTKTLRTLVLTVLLSIVSTWIAAQHTRNTDTIPDANLLNGIKYIRNGKLAAQERDSLRAAINIYDERIRNYQKLIFNFETTVKEHDTKDSTRLAQIAYYKQEVNIYKSIIAEHRKALQDQKLRHLKMMIILGVVTVSALIL